METALINFVGVADPDLLRPFENELTMHKKQYLFDSCDNRDMINEIMNSLFYQNRFENAKQVHYTGTLYQIDEYIQEFIDNTCNWGQNQYRLNKYYIINTTGTFNPSEYSVEYYVFVLLRKVIYIDSNKPIIIKYETLSGEVISSEEFPYAKAKYNEDSDWFKEHFIVIRKPHLNNTIT